MHRSLNFLTISLLSCCLICSIDYAEANTEAARRAATSAETLVDQNSHRAALAALTGVDCAAEKRCLTLVNFTYGWVYEEWADARPERSSSLLARAQNYYQKAHRHSPGNAQILINLAVAARRAGDSKTAAGAISRAIRVDPDKAGQLYLFLGDALYAAQDYQGAVNAYRNAIEENPGRPQNQRRLIEAYRKMSATDMLVEHSRDIRHSFPAAAALGFEYAIRLAARDDSRTAAEALPYWTAIRSDLGNLGPGDLARLPGLETWSSAGLRQLYGIVGSDAGLSADTNIDWWLRTEPRKDAIARLLRLRASTIRARAERAEASGGEREASLRAAIEFLSEAVRIAPDVEAYLHGELAGSSNAKLDAAADLVALHHVLKAGGDLESLSGISEGELEFITEILFSGKAGAYAAGQLRAIQRYHTILGMIYFQTKEDTSRSRARNSVFQLEHVLETAKKIEEEDPTKYQPLPEIKKLLAKVNERLGEKHPDKPKYKRNAARYSVEAAMAYMETDNLRQAGEMLTLARTSGATAGRVAAVSTVLDSRKAIAAGGMNLIQVNPQTQAVTYDAKLNWLQRPETLGLPDRFVDGQRFKSLSDLGSKASGDANKDLAIKFNAEAFDIARKQQILTSPSDIRRLQSIDTSLTTSVRNVPSKTRATLVQGTVQPGARPAPRSLTDSSPPLEWTLPSSNQTVVIQIDPEVLEKSTEVLERGKMQQRN